MLIFIFFCFLELDFRLNSTHRIFLVVVPLDHWTAPYEPEPGMNFIEYPCDMYNLMQLKHLSS